MADVEESVEVPYRPGLEKVPVAISKVCYLDGDVGTLEYRGYPIEGLARDATFEEVAYLLLENELPTRSELTAFKGELTRHRRLKFRIIDILKSLPESGHPMHALAATVSAMGMFYPGKYSDMLDPRGARGSRRRLHPPHRETADHGRGLAPHTSRRPPRAATRRPESRLELPLYARW